MHTYRIGDAAALPGVSPDTVRRPVDGGVPAVAVIKSTNVVVERPKSSPSGP